MVIEESVVIHADRKKIWRVFTHLGGWKEWNRTALNVSGESDRMEEGRRFSFSLHGFGVPVTVEPVIDYLTPPEELSWSGRMYGVSSRHEFLFREQDGAVLVTSRETFRGATLLLAGPAFPESTIRKLTASLLGDLKGACEEIQVP
ncbi:MAG: SRPBCC family protein [Nitrospiraceae bacterium]|nr:SRPBCC family protein [Nitrospiraceae bacterium]